MKTALHIFQSCIQPILTNGSEVWSPYLTFGHSQYRESATWIYQTYLNECEDPNKITGFIYKNIVEPENLILT